MERDRMQYARDIKNYMVKHELNQTMFSEVVGCSNQSVSNWLRGAKTPTGELKKKVDAILDGEKKEGEKEVSLAKNGSGYYDPTMHNALKNVVVGQKPACLRGDIYTYEAKNSTVERKVLVVGADDRKLDRWISVIVLTDDAKGINIVPVKAGAMMYADCDRVTYVDRNNVLNFVRSATDEEMAQIDKSILEGLGMSTGDAELYNKLQTSESYASDLEKDVKQAEVEIELLKHDCQEIANENHDLKEQLKNIINAQGKKTTNSDEIVRMKTMVEIYKAQNEMLLEKLIG